MTREFCTIFDKNYLLKALSLYHSLVSNCDSFRLWMLCMDDYTYDLLNKMKLRSARLIKVSEIEDPELLEAKKDRNAGEYCWTCKPSFMLYIIKKEPDINILSYIDADSFFYSAPEPIYEELGNNSILLTPHDFPEPKKFLEINGLFNAGFVLMKNNDIGISCLRWWRDKCNEWCYAQKIDGKNGDQKYLDEVPKIFNKVKISNNRGINTAQWNISGKKIEKIKNKLYINNNDLVFYHYHDFKIYPHSYFLTPIPWSHYSEKSLKKTLIYSIYIKNLYRVLKEIKKFDKNFSFGLKDRPALLEHLKNNALPRSKHFIKFYIINFIQHDRSRKNKT
jgi:hypothetical protein